MLEEILGQEAAEEFLGQVLGPFGTVSLPANEGIDRPPVSPAQLFHRLRRLR